ncbi:hypothetical protein SARC_12354 [Sphaeroforma arctica JP610]|uniref:Uncharacterized protein n=1 Tax=Sphaeroforma arctica JP610 TaxID=667725 RepID=A0A0L0FEC9_9EUKA|nr:hypothetical protein SARC_12354 [Sphaeroforma arctica JP610]KNC75112.1 hypothetical protein SARC_12354 [Sphaeroforma arctica JP610]|eukprot:XP_014149014.1 hypothetical protein SARC_12354 [Sphaeroforma arctica JP610]
MTGSTALSVCATVLLGTAVVLTMAAILVICRRFDEFKSERNYLLYFSWTMLGFVLLLTHQTVWSWDTSLSQNNWSYILFLLGENLIVTPECLRAARLVVLYYGYPALIPRPVWRESTQVNPIYLRTNYLMLYLFLLQVPVVILWLCMATTAIMMFEYICMVYTVLQIIVMLVSVSMLRRKKEDMEKHQLSESSAVFVFGLGLLVFVLFDSVRVIAGQEGYTDISSVWVIVDLASITVLVLLALVIWATHYQIILDRVLSKGSNLRQATGSVSSAESSTKGAKTADDAILIRSLPPDTNESTTTALTQSTEKCYKTMKSADAIRPHLSDCQRISSSEVRD